MKVALVVLYAVLGFGMWFTHSNAEVPGVLPPTCYTVGHYTKTQNPIRFCAPETEQTY